MSELPRLTPISFGSLPIGTKFFHEQGVRMLLLEDCNIENINVHTKTRPDEAIVFITNAHNYGERRKIRVREDEQVIPVVL